MIYQQKVLRLYFWNCRWEYYVKYLAFSLFTYIFLCNKEILWSFLMSVCVKLNLTFCKKTYFLFQLHRICKLASFHGNTSFQNFHANVFPSREHSFPRTMWNRLIATFLHKAIDALEWQWWWWKKMVSSTYMKTHEIIFKFWLNWICGTNTNTDWEKPSIVLKYSNLTNQNARLFYLQHQKTLNLPWLSN